MIDDGPPAILRAWAPLRDDPAFRPSRFALQLMGKIERRPRERSAPQRRHVRVIVNPAETPRLATAGWTRPFGTAAAFRRAEDPD